MSSLAERIKEARGALSAAEFARRIGVSRSAIHQAEHGNKSIRAALAFAIEAKTGYAAKWIALGYGPKKAADRTSCAEMR